MITRKAVLTSYNNRCAISGLQVTDLLIASHIIPWKDSEARRADPTNGIALNSLYDAAFDKGYMTFDEDWRVCLAGKLKAHLEDSDLCSRLLKIEGAELVDAILASEKGPNGVARYRLSLQSSNNMNYSSFFWNFRQLR